MHLDQQEQLSLVECPDQETPASIPETGHFEDLCQMAMQTLDLPAGFAAWQQNKATRVLKLGKTPVLAISGAGPESRILLKANRQLAVKAGLPLDSQSDEIRPQQMDPGIFADSLQAFFELAVEQSAGDKFACCSLYRQCSAAAACVQPDRLLALSCAYRVNLRQGRNFYS